MISADHLSPEGRRRLMHDLQRASLVHFHPAAFKMLHNGEEMVPAPHTDAMIYWIEKLAIGEINRLIITVPPRHGKSELVSGSFPAWLLGNDMAALVTIVSYGLDLSAALADKARTIMKHPNFQRLFPDVKLKRGRDKGDAFELETGGGVRAASKAGAMTGFGTHFMIVDDYHKANESLSTIERQKAIEQFETTFSNRFNNLNDVRIVIVQQRIHEDDLVGWAKSTGQWTHINLPAFAVEDEDIPLPRGKIWKRKKGDVLAPALASAKFLNELKAEMGDAKFGAQFQGDPSTAEGGIFSMDLFGQYDDAPERTFFTKMVQSWDPATSERRDADYSVGMTWGYGIDGKWYLLDLIRVRLAAPELFDRVVAWHRKWKADALIIEGTSIGLSLYQHVRMRARLPGKLLAPTPRTSKEERAAGSTVHLKNGAFLLPASAPWLPELRRELIAFPDYCRNDDQVDAIVQFLDFTFSSDGWVQQQYDRNGRPQFIKRPVRRSRYYDGDAPSAGSS